jgi:hypothetical protein
MHRANIAILAVLVPAGCRASLAAPAQRSGVADVNDAGVRAAPRPRPLVAIAAFDCEKVIDLPGVVAPSGLIPAAQGIRAWHGGATGGANWNVTDLRCVVAVDTTCTAGKLGVVLRVGQTVVAERQLDVGASLGSVELPVLEKQWRRGLDQPSKRVGVGLPYKTGVFRATAIVDCRTPDEINLRSSAYPEAAADAVFVTGFAWGE